MLVSCPSCMYPEVGFVDHMVVLFVIFWGTSILFSTVAAVIYIHIDFLFLKKKGNKECYPSHVQLQFYQCSLQAWLFSPTPLYKGLRCRDFSHSVWAGVSAAHVLFLTVKSWACANSSCLLGRCWEPKKASSLFVSEDLGAVDTKRISALG